MPARPPACLPACLPTRRDLAEQTYDSVNDFLKYLSEPSLRSVLLVGGVAPAPQERSLQAGVDVVVGTPGRVMDLIERGKLACDQVKFFVLDEAGERCVRVCGGEGGCEERGARGSARLQSHHAACIHLPTEPFPLLAASLPDPPPFPGPRPPAGHGQPGPHPQALPAPAQGRGRRGAPAGGWVRWCAAAGRAGRQAVEQRPDPASKPVLLLPLPPLPSTGSITADAADDATPCCCCHSLLPPLLLPPHPPLQVLLFSATLHSPEVRALAARICQNPILVDLKGKGAVPETGGCCWWDWLLGAAGAVWDCVWWLIGKADGTLAGCFCGLRGVPGPVEALHPCFHLLRLLRLMRLLRLRRPPSPPPHPPLPASCSGPRAGAV